MSLPPQLEVEHRRLEPAALALLARRLDRGHHTELGEDHAGAVAGRAGTLGVGAEQRRLDAVLLGERLADRIQQPGVRRRVAPARALDRAWSTTTTPSRPATEPWTSELLPEPATPVRTREHAEGDVDVRRSAGCASTPSRTSSDPVAVAHLGLEGGAVVEVATGDGPAPAQPVVAALEDHLAPGGAGARPEVDDVVGDRDRLRLVLDDQHGVALVAQLRAAAGSSARCRAGAARWSARRRRR